MGQLRTILRAEFLIDCIGLNKIQGQPLKVREVIAAIEELLGGTAAETTTAIRQAEAF
jgi:2-oxoglutarate ferredoxin oxidoreductase subunit alpha